MQLSVSLHKSWLTYSHIHLFIYTLNKLQLRVYLTLEILLVYTTNKTKQTKQNDSKKTLISGLI